MRRLVGAGLVLFMLAACGGEPEPGPDVSTPVQVQQTGSAVRDGRVGVAALLRVNDDRAVGPIELQLAFVDANGKAIATTDESLPYCGPGASCWWASTFFVEDFGKERVQGVRLAVIGADPYAGDVDITPITVQRSGDGTITGSAPAGEGLAYVIASQNAKPRWGMSVSMSAETGSAISIPHDLLPSLKDEELRAYFYRGAVARGD